MPSLLGQQFNGSAGVIQAMTPVADPDSHGAGSIESLGMNIYSGSGSGPHLPGSSAGPSGTSGGLLKQSSNQFSGGQIESSKWSTPMNNCVIKVPPSALSMNRQLI